MPAQRMGMEYTQAFNMVASRARASNVKSLLGRFANSISAGESEREFIAQEAEIEAERYTNEYDRNIESLRKWTDAFAALMFSVTLVMVVALVATLLGGAGGIGKNFVALMFATVLVIMAIGVFMIYRAAPVEQKTYESQSDMTQDRRITRYLFLTLFPTALAVFALFMVFSPFGTILSLGIALVILGIAMAPAGFYAWKDDSNVTKLDSDLPTFLRSMGNVAGSTGVTLPEALTRISRAEVKAAGRPGQQTGGGQYQSFGSLEPHLDRLHVRLGAQLPTADCWEKFREETGSELVSRTTHMLVDGAAIGGQVEEVGRISAQFALNVTQLRAKRQMTASSFSFLTVPMHATMTFILMFILEIIRNFSTEIERVKTEIAQRDIELPSRLDLPSNVSEGGLGIFGVSPDDMTMVTWIMIFVIFQLIVANSLAPAFAAGGSHYKIIPLLSIQTVISGLVMISVPFITARLFINPVL